MAVTELPTCRKCGVVTRKKVEIFQEGTEIIPFSPLCESCYRAALVGAEWLRVEFEELLAGGMDREQANEVMIERIDLRHQLAKGWRPYDKEH